MLKYQFFLFHLHFNKPSIELLMSVFFLQAARNNYRIESLVLGCIINPFGKYIGKSIFL